MSAPARLRSRDIRIEYHGRFHHCYLIGVMVGNRIVWSDLKDTNLEMAKAKAYERYGNNIIITHN